MAMDSMIKIHFLDVGQGDTLMLEWLSDGVSRFAMIDCCEKRGKNPAIKWLKRRRVKRIEFMILSHPHSDHYSGFENLLDYCESNSIQILRFYHTAYLTANSFYAGSKQVAQILDYAVTSVPERNRLRRLYKQINRLNSDLKRPVGEIAPLDSGRKDISLGEGMKIEILAPQFRDLQEYLYLATNAKIQSKSVYEFSENNADANILCSVLRLVGPSWSVLLTSDVLRSKLEELFDSDKSFTDGLAFLQIPHHGSTINHYEEGWREVKKKEGIATGISVGIGYGHPGKNVVEFFSSNFSSIHCTNKVGGFLEFFGGEEGAQPSDFHALECHHDLMEFLSEEELPNPLNQGPFTISLDESGLVDIEYDV